MTRLLHPWFGLGFVFFFALQAMNWWQVMTWTPADSHWMKHIKQYVTRSDSAESPETGFFNAGQKIFTVRREFARKPPNITSNCKPAYCQAQRRQPRG